MRIGIFYDPDLPFTGIRPDKSSVIEMSKYAELIDCSNYKLKLQENFDCLVNLHSPYFIMEAWNQIKKHLYNGKGFVNIGYGIPFSIPVIKSSDAWVPERQKTAYHEELNIRYALKIHRDRIDSLSVNPDLPLLKGFEDCFTIQDTYGLIVQFTKYKDIPEDVGSSGPMDALILPLLTGKHGNGRETAAPVVLIENTKGEYEGGRWIFINQKPDETFWGNQGSKLIKTLSEYTAQKAYEVIIRPNYASYYPGEQPAMLVQAQNFNINERSADINLTVNKNGELIYQKEFLLDLKAEIAYLSFPTNLNVEPGMYLLTASISIKDEPVRILRNGFYGYDKDLLESGEVITCGKDYFYKDGKPMPVVGMTYMQADVHRKFLYLPNVQIWDSDFAQMKRAGINMVRTGIWTGHRTVMFNDGIASEEILRALDAMFLIAKKYDIPLVFNFFAFAPPLWEGINPYLDLDLDHIVIFASPA